MGKAATQPKLTDWWQSWENTPANASLGAAQERLRLVYNKSLTDALVRVLTDLGQECTLGFAAVEDGGSVYLVCRAGIMQRALEVGQPPAKKAATTLSLDTLQRAFHPLKLTAAGYADLAPVVAVWLCGAVSGVVATRVSGLERGLNDRLLQVADPLLVSKV